VQDFVIRAAAAVLVAGVVPRGLENFGQGRTYVLA